MRVTLFRLIVLGCCAITAVKPGFGWGREGHRLGARVAYEQLNPATRAKLAAILNSGETGSLEDAMADAATWPDEINKPATKSGNWHFIDVPVTAPFSVAGLCGADGDCALFRIADFAARLKNNTTGFQLARAPIPARSTVSQEVAFLIHFVGDIHQPLHASTSGDRGGNCVNLVKPLGHDDRSRETTELHAVWDVDEVNALFDDLDGLNPDRSISDEDHAAAALFARYQAHSPAAWEKASVEDWARESNDAARTAIYGKLGIPPHTSAPGACAANIAPVSVDEAYLTANAALTEDRIMRAGIRLGNLLNDACAGNGCAPTVGEEAPGALPARSHLRHPQPAQ